MTIDKQRTLLWVLVASLVLLVHPCDLQAADGPGEASFRCPGAVAWREAHRDQLVSAMARRDESRTFSAPELRAELRRRFEADQRERVELINNPRDPDVGKRVRQMDQDNLAWVKKVVKDNGVPTVAQVGESGVHWTWLLVQHADDDPQFQSSMLARFAERQEAGEFSADDLAKLTDRVLVAEGKPQRFGTQFDWLSGKFNPKVAGNVADIEANRRALGLMPLVDYACLMNGKLKGDK